MFKRMVIVCSALALLAFYVAGGVAAQGAAEGAGAPVQAVQHICRVSGELCDALAQLFGLTAAQLQAERAAGKTLSELGAEKGVAEEQIVSTLRAAIEPGLQEAVADGRMTPAQAAATLERWLANVQGLLDQAYACGTFAGCAARSAGAGCGGRIAARVAGGCAMGGRLGQALARQGTGS